MPLALRLSTPEAIQALVEAIGAAYANEDSLFQALRLFDARVNFFSGGDYRTVTERVVDHSYRGGRLPLLLCALRFSRRGNPELIAFEAKYTRRFFDAGLVGTDAEVRRLDVLLDALDALVDSPGLDVTSLIETSYAEIVGEALPWAGKPVPGPFRRALVSDLADGDGSGGSRLVELVERVRSGLPADAREPLTRWLQTVAGHAGVARRPRTVAPPPPPADAHCYVMVRIVPASMPGKFRATVWTDREGAVEEAWAGDGDTIDDLRAAIAAQMETRGSRLSRALKGLDGDQISYEFILPRSLFDERVEAWPIATAELPIGKVHAVALRSHERIYCMEKWERPWTSRWEKLFGHDALVPRMGRFDPEQDDTGDPFRLDVVRNSALLGFVLLGPVTVGRGDPVTELLRLGIPVLVWPRCVCPTSRAGLDALADRIEAERDARGAVLQVRAGAPSGDGLEDHVVLLWDDPRRRPPDHDHDLIDPAS